MVEGAASARDADKRVAARANNFMASVIIRTVVQLESHPLYTRASSVTPERWINVASEPETYDLPDIPSRHKIIVPS